jgi:hypothetical protein
VHDRVNALERPAHRVAVTDVTGLKLDVAGEVTGTLSVRVDLPVEVVESTHLVALSKQPVGEVRADEPGAAGDQNAHGRA